MRNLFILSSVLLACGCARYQPLPPAVATVTTPEIVAPDPNTSFASASSVSRPSLCATTKISTVINLADVAALLRTSNFAKNEFETTDVYRKRSEEKLSRVYDLIAKKGGKTLAFILPVPPVWVKYNADRKLMHIGDEIFGLLQTGRAPKGERHLVVSQTRRMIGTYIGQNAFGAKKEIVKKEGTELGVHVQKTWSMTWPKDFKPFSIQSNTEKAKLLKESLSVLFVGKLVPPYFTADRDRLTPEFNVPVDEVIDRETIYINIECAVVIDRRSGDVIRNLNI